MTDILNGWWQVRVGNGTLAIGLVSLNSNSETHMTALCNARLIYGRGWISRVFICCAAFKMLHMYSRLDMILGKVGSKKPDVYDSKISLASRVVKVERSVSN